MRPALSRLILAAALCGVPTMTTPGAFAQEPGAGANVAGAPAGFFDVNFAGGNLPEFVGYLNKSTNVVNFIVFPGYPAPQDFVVPPIHLRNVSYMQLARTLMQAGITSGNTSLGVNIDEQPGDGTPIMQFTVNASDKKSETITRICQLASIVPSTASPEDQKKRLADVLQVLELALAASSKDAKPEIQVHAATRTMIITGNATQQAIVDQVRFALAEAEMNDATARRMEATERNENAGGAEAVKKNAMIQDLQQRLAQAQAEQTNERDARTKIQEILVATQSEVQVANTKNKFLEDSLKESSDRLAAQRNSLEAIRSIGLQATAERDAYSSRVNNLLTDIKTLREKRDSAKAAFAELARKVGEQHVDARQAKDAIASASLELEQKLDSLQALAPTRQK